jgi:hypothetical protein
MQNLELAFNVVERIKREPEHFRMRFWGVPKPEYTACLAGHTLLASGYQLVATNAFRHPESGSLVTYPGLAAAGLLGMTARECKRGIHFWSCNPFCENMPEDAALDNFLKLVLEEEERRLVRS